MVASDATAREVIFFSAPFLEEPNIRGGRSFRLTVTDPDTRKTAELKVRLGLISESMCTWESYGWLLVLVATTATWLRLLSFGLRGSGVECTSPVVSAFPALSAAGVAWVHGQSNNLKKRLSQ